MPRLGKEIAIGAPVSVSSHHLKQNNVLKLFRGKYDLNIPGLRFNGTVISTHVDDKNKLICGVVLGFIPDHPVHLFANSLKYEGKKKDNSKCTCS